MKAKAANKSLLALAASFFLLLGFAPEEGAAQPAVHVGVKGGVSYTKLRLTFDETDLTPGLIGGVFGRIGFKSGIAAQPEVLYTQKGGVLDIPGDSSITEIEYALDYIEVPVLLQLALPLGAAFRPNVYAGPYLGVAVRKRRSAAPEGRELSQDPETYKDLDYGFALGASIDVPAGRRAVTVDFRWTRGARDLDPTVIKGAVEDAENSAQNGALTVAVGVLF